MSEAGSLSGQSLIDQVAGWAWAGALPWTGVVCGVVALLVVKQRRTVVAHLAAAAVAVTAGWWAGPLAASAVVGVAVAARTPGRRVRPIDRAHRGTLGGVSMLSILLWGNRWAVHEVGGTFGGARTAAVIAVTAVSMVLVVWRPRPPALDPQRAFTRQQRDQVIARDGYQCAYCGVPGNAPGVQLAVDHVDAHSRGGRTSVDNARMACGPCNTAKSDRSWDDFVQVFRRRHGFPPGEWARPHWWQRLGRR